MTEQEKLAKLSEASQRLCRAFADMGYIAFVVRQNHDGSINICGPAMPGDVVTDLFSRAAEGYEDQEPASGSLN